MKAKTVFFLFGITLLAFFLRFYLLGDTPRGFYKDEAFLGYNAYSLLQTAKDMNGNFLPLHLQSFLYSPAGYSYFSIPFIALFGLSAFSVRFASALFGSLTVVIVFFLTAELFAKVKQKNTISLLAAFFLTISPWHINLSRTATENVLVVFFISIGVLLYLYWIKKQRLYLLFLSFLSFGIPMFVYQAPRSFLPLFIPMLVFLFWKQLKDKKQYILVGALFFLMILAPMLWIFSSKQLLVRINTVSVFSTPGT
ncbi:MAG: ArnT family glycosyltransferase, partial [Candidatus Levyibacteriota bacterium]